MSINKMKKREIRKLWILKSLFDCKQWSQKDIKKLWYLMSATDVYSKEIDTVRGINFSETATNKSWKMLLKKYEKYVKDGSVFNAPENEMEKIKDDFKKYRIKLTLEELNKTKKTFNAISKQCSSDISNIMKELKNEAIIKDEIIVKKIAPKHARPVDSVYKLIENHDVLYLILEKINDPLTPTKFKEFMLNELMSSEFLERVVNKELVKIIEEKLHLSLEANDKKLLLFCLRRYSIVLYNTLKEINKPIPMINEDTPIYLLYDPEKHRNGFMLDIKNWAYNDLKSDIFSVNFEVSVRIKDDEGEIINHTNSNMIQDPVEKKYWEMSGRAMVEARYGITVNSDENEDNSIKQEENENILPNYKDMVNKQLEWVEMMNRNEEHRINYLKDEIEDETMFIKDNGEKLDLNYLYIPSKNVSPF